MEMYEVGGCVRDELLGVPSKDIDFTVTLPPGSYANPYIFMVEELEAMSFEIFKDKEGMPIGHEFLTVRARFPRKEIKMNASDALNRFQFANPGLTADFVLARKESDYTDGRRPDKVVPGTLEDDLARRDFTMNAIAKVIDGSSSTGTAYIDPFNGVADIRAGIIRAVGNARERLAEDALRAVRAIRFSVTKGFTIDAQLAEAMESYAVLTSLENKISDERIQQELSKMFRYNTVSSLGILNAFPKLTRSIFSGSVSLDATMKTKGRGR